MPTTRHGNAETLGDRVRQHRQAITDKNGRPLSQERLAERAGLHRTFVGHVERGRTNIALSNLVKIAAAIGVDPGVLVQGLRPEDD